MTIQNGCRSCGDKDLFQGVSLGDIPVAGRLTKFPNEAVSTPETNMVICSNCGLGQLTKDLDPADLYVDYNWRTSTSISYLSYIHDFCRQKILPEVDVHHSRWVLEIASNDGYLLSYLKRLQVDVLGVDPAENISRYAMAKGVPVITEFFNLKLAKEIAELKAAPRWIVANNVLAHTPDIKSFMAGIAYLADENTTITIENPSIMNILLDNQFETIFHEHYSYLSVNSVKHLANEYGLRLFNVEKVSPQGGSYRYWLTKSPSKGIDDSVNLALEEELEAGLLDRDRWLGANKTTHESIKKFSDKVKDLVSQGKRIGAYAASAKASTVINLANLTSKDLLCIADDVKEKQGRYIPSTDIPVVTSDELVEADLSDVIIFSHNIKNDIEENLNKKGYQGSVWVWNS